MRSISVGRAILLALFPGLLSACASITSGTTQSVGVVTTPESGAACTLVNDKGRWTLAQTPGSTTVDRAYGDLVVACVHQDGSTGSATAASDIAAATYGNIVLVGSVVWAAVDLTSGAAFAYPDTISVAMAPAPSAPVTPIAPLAAMAEPATRKAEAPVAIAQDDARTRLKRLQELREGRRLSEADYHARVRAIVETVGAPAAPRRALPGGG